MSGIVKAVGKVVGTLTGAEQQRKSAEKQAAAQIAQAREAQAAQTAMAEAERAQTERLAAQQAAFEVQRNASIANQAAGEQNSKTSSLTPDVQLAASDGVDGAGKARSRRAQFRTEYNSGVSI